MGRRVSLNVPNLIITKSYGQAAREGLIAGSTQVHALGFHSNITTTRMEDVSQLGVAIVPIPASAITLEVVSTSASDTSGGTGVRVIDVIGLDSSFLRVEEEVISNGTTPVATTQSFIRINDLHTEEVGSNDFSVGTIDVTDGSGVTFSRIVPQENRALQAHYTVPSNITAFIMSWAGAAGGSSLRYQLCATIDPDDSSVLTGVFSPLDIIMVRNGMPVHEFTQPLLIPAQADVKISVLQLSGAETEAATSIEALLISG